MKEELTTVSRKKPSLVLVLYGNIFYFELYCFGIVIIFLIVMYNYNNNCSNGFIFSVSTMKNISLKK